MPGGLNGAEKEVGEGEEITWRRQEIHYLPHYCQQPSSLPVLSLLRSIPSTSSILICPCLLSPWWKVSLITSDTTAQQLATWGKTNYIYVWLSLCECKRLIHHLQVQPLPFVKSEAEGTRFMDWIFPLQSSSRHSNPPTPLPHRLCVTTEP